MLIIPNITIKNVIKWIISQVSDADSSPTEKTGKQFYFLFDSVVFIFTLILRDLVLGLCLSGGEIYGLEGGLPATVRGSISGLTHSSL